MYTHARAVCPNMMQEGGLREKGEAPQVLKYAEREGRYCSYKKRTQQPTDISKQPIRTRYLGHVTAYQPIRDHYLLTRSVLGLYFLLVVGTRCVRTSIRIYFVTNILSSTKGTKNTHVQKL